MEKFKRVFVPHYNFRFSPEPLKSVAEEVVFVCEKPMFDHLIGEENKGLFEHRINDVMKTYDPEEDLIAFYGDSIIFAMMVIRAIEQWGEIHVARYSSKENRYLIRTINAEDFTFGVLCDG